jgi:dynein heavy chain, axonemal
MAAYMADYELFQIEITRTYAKNEWRDDIRKLFRKSGVEGRRRTSHSIETNSII